MFFSPTLLKYSTEISIYIISFRELYAVDIDVDVDDSSSFSGDCDIKQELWGNTVLKIQILMRLIFFPP